MEESCGGARSHARCVKKRIDARWKKNWNNGIARLLLSRGANVDVESSEGTPLHVSAERGRFDMMEILLEHHADAIMLDPADATLYSNRSFCHLKIGGARDALVDANACINLQPDWPKGYYRKGAALMSLKEYKEARDAFMDGLKLDPSNLDIQNAYWEADEAMIKKHSTGQSVRQAI